MKRILLPCFFLASFALAAVAQPESFRLEEREKEIKGTASAEWLEGALYAENLSESPLTFSIQLIENTLNPGWGYSVCTPGDCWLGAPEHKTASLEVAPGNKGEFKLTLEPNGVADAGTLVYRVYNENYPEDADTITFQVETGTSSIVLQNAPKSVNVYPNPVRQSLTLQIDGTEQGRLEIYDLNGRKVISDIIIISATGNVDVSNLSGGMYQLVFRGNSGTAYTARFIKN